jgi:hypothetical protein
MPCRLTLESLFPDIPHFREVNLNDWLSQHCAERPASPAEWEREIDRMQSELGVSAYGGWMEYREWMWSGSYMTSTKKYWHLGLDVYLHHGTKVQLPFDVTVIDTFYNEDCEVGWGGRLTVQREPGAPAIVFGHLEATLPRRGARLEAGKPFTEIATWPVNGNVFEHLHIQLIRPDLLPTLDWDSLDGYGYQEQAADFPHPLRTDV